MGTHGLLAFVVNGRTKGVYNHYDSYPTGLGHEIIKFILSISAEQKQQMSQQVKKLEWYVKWPLIPHIVTLDPTFSSS